MEGTKQGVMQYISTFDKYSFLWTENLQEAYERFMKTNPSLEAFEAELQKYMAIETEVTGIPGVHNIGSLSLETQPLKHSLKAEAASWKAQFAKNLHKQGSEELKALDNYIRETTLKLNRKVLNRITLQPLSIEYGDLICRIARCFRPFGYMNWILEINNIRIWVDSSCQSSCKAG